MAIRIAKATIHKCSRCIKTRGYTVRLSIQLRMARLKPSSSNWCDPSKYFSFSNTSMEIHLQVEIGWRRNMNYCAVVNTVGSFDFIRTVNWLSTIRFCHLYGDIYMFNSGCVSVTV